MSDDTHLATVESRVGHLFRDRRLLAQALTHRSATGPVGNNERLEFLGDAVLDLAISESLMERFPDAPEGDLSRLRASLVNTRILARRATEKRLGEALVLGKGEEKSRGREKASILAAVYEAVLGAVFADAGFDVARTLVRHHFEEEIEVLSDQRFSDFKTRLQELTQRQFRDTPEYHLIETHGPDHARAFVMEIRIAGEVYGTGEGTTKKAAEQQAALEALRRLGKER